MKTTDRLAAFPRPGDAKRQPEAMAQFARPQDGGIARFAGRWVNHLGSVLDPTVEGNSVSGRIELRPETARDSVAGELLGMVDGSAIALVSRWEERACLGTWLGELIDSDGQEAIMLSWELLRHLDDPDRPMDMAIGQAMFTRLPSH